MVDSKLEWIKNYITLNRDRKNKKMVLGDDGEERDKSVVMDCTPFSIKVAIDCGAFVTIKILCVLKGNKDYHIDTDYFDMSKFEN